METRFGFVVSEKLETLLKDAVVRLKSGTDKNDPMYTYRNELIQQVNLELVENLMIKQAEYVSDTKRRESLLKLGNTVQSVTNKIVQVMLSEDSDDVVLKSKGFLDVSVARDQDGNLRMGMEVPQAFYDNMNANFERIKTGEYNDDIIKSVQTHLKEFDNLLLEHFAVTFSKSLGWGMIKLKLAKGVKATLTKANKIAIDQMIPKMSLTELQEASPHIRQLFFVSDKVGSEHV